MSMMHLQYISKGSLAQILNAFLVSSWWARSFNRQSVPNKKQAWAKLIVILQAPEILCPSLKIVLKKLKIIIVFLIHIYDLPLEKFFKLVPYLNNIYGPFVRRLVAIVSVVNENTSVLYPHYISVYILPL